MLLLQVLKTEAQKDPLILFIRNVEKSILGNFERYIKLETLKDVRLVVIGSHTSDQQKEKVRNRLCLHILIFATHENLIVLNTICIAISSSSRSITFLAVSWLCFFEFDAYGSLIERVLHYVAG